MKNTVVGVDSAKEVVVFTVSARQNLRDKSNRHSLTAYYLALLESVSQIWCIGHICQSAASNNQIIQSP